jgi:hypothetical protein
VKQSGEVNTTDMQVSIREDNLERHVEVDTADVVEVDTADVDEIASVDEDCSRGMKSNATLINFFITHKLYFPLVYKKDALSSFHNEKYIIYCRQLHSQGMPLHRLP